MLTLTVGDHGSGATITGTCNAVLTGATLEAHVRRADGTIVTRTASVVSGPAGTWSCALADGDLTVAGEYQVEIQATYSGGGIQTFAYDTAGRVVKFNVRAQYA